MSRVPRMQWMVLIIGNLDESMHISEVIQNSNYRNGAKGPRNCLKWMWDKNPKMYFWYVMNIGIYEVAKLKIVIRERQFACYLWRATGSAYHLRPLPSLNPPVAGSDSFSVVQDSPLEFDMVISSWQVMQSDHFTVEVLIWTSFTLTNAKAERIWERKRSDTAMFSMILFWNQQIAFKSEEPIYIVQMHVQH